MKTLKFVVFSFIILASISSAAIYYAFSHVDDVIIDVIEQTGSELTQAPVKVDSVSINLSYGSGSLTNLSIKNPVGFSNKTLYISNKIAFKVDSSTFNQPVKVINKVDIRDIYFYVEPASGASQNKPSLNNIQTIAERLSSINDLTDMLSSQAISTSDTESASIKVMIERITFADLRIQLQVNTSDNVESRSELRPGLRSLTVPGFFVENIGDKAEGLTLDALGRRVLIIMFAAVDAAVQAELDGLSQEVDGLAAQDALGEWLQKTSSDNDTAK